MFGIPEDKMPEYLKDEKRLNVLFAPLRNKNANAKDYMDKVTTWKSIIKVYCEANSVLVISLQGLNNVFSRHGRCPQCLEQVLQDMLNKGEVQPLEEFMKKSSSSWSGWLTDIIIKRPFNWSLKTLQKTLFSSQNGQYVHLEVLKIKSADLLTSLPKEYKNKVITVKELTEALKTENPNIDSLKLLLHYLENTEKVSLKFIPCDIINNDIEALLLKVCECPPVLPITEKEIAIHTLEQNEKLISKHIASLEEKSSNIIDEAKKHLRNKHRELAKNALIRKHSVQNKLEKAYNALQNVQKCLEKLQDTYTNAQVWEAYKVALKSFNTTYKESGMSEEAVEDTMLELQDLLDVHNDIQATLSHPVNEDDSEELADELEQLMNDMQEENKKDSDEMNDLALSLDKLNISLPEVASESNSSTKKISV